MNAICAICCYMYATYGNFNTWSTESIVESNEAAAIVRELNVDVNANAYGSSRRYYRIIINLLLDTIHLAHEIAAARFLNYSLRKC